MIVDRMTWSTDAIVPVTSLINHESFAAIYVIIGLRDAKKAMKAAREEITGLEASSNCFHLPKNLGTRKIISFLRGRSLRRSLGH